VVSVWFSLFLGAFVSLFIIINPLSTASVFHALSKGNSRSKNRFIVRKACLIAFMILVFFLFLGDFILNFFGVSLEAFQVASGILVFGVGYNMIYKRDRHFRSEEELDDALERDDISIIPLAIPMMSGPGAIATSLVLVDSLPSVTFFVPVVIAMFCVCLIAYFLLLNAHGIDKFLGEVGITVVDKILGLIVLVMGIQFVLTGLGPIVSSWLV
jgi:multiple antibiotic resistance protein